MHVTFDIRRMRPHLTACLKDKKIEHVPSFLTAGSIHTLVNCLTVCKQHLKGFVTKLK